MRRALMTATVIGALAFCVFGVYQVHGLGPGTWRSGITLQNLGDEEAMIVMEFRDEQGDVAGTWSAGTLLAVGGSLEIYLPNLSDAELPGGDRYSVTIYSDSPIASMSTMTNYQYQIADSYNGMEPATELFTPYIFHDHSSWWTEIYVQNASDSASTVHVDFSPSVKGNAYATSRSIAPHGTVCFDTSDAEYAPMGSFIGSAVVTSTDNIDLVGVIVHTRLTASGTRVMVSVRANTEADSGTLLAAPSLYNRWDSRGGDWRSGITIQNVDPTNQATFDIVFQAHPDSKSGPFDGAVRDVTLGPREAWQFYLPADTLDEPSGAAIPANWKGSAAVTVTGGGGRLVAMIIHTNYGTQALGYRGVANAYFAAASGSDKLAAPSIYSNFPSGPGKWISGLNIQNLSSTDTVTATVTFRAHPDSPSGYPWVGVASNLQLGPLEAIELWGPNPTLDGGAPLPSGFKGGATVELTDASGEVTGAVLHSCYGRGVAAMYMAAAY